MDDCHRIDYSLLRALVPRYCPRPHNTRGAEQEKILFLLAAYLDPVLARWGIDTPLRKAHFLGQTSVESRDYTSMFEDRNDHRPVAGKRYEGKRVLGNTHPGDGAKYIGRGMLQLTGRYNYEKVGGALDRWHVEHDQPAAGDEPGPMCLTRRLDLGNHPERASEFPAAIETACQYWVMRNINRWADKDDPIGVTHAINTRLLALGERTARTKKAKDLLVLPKLGTAINGSGP